MAESSTSKVKKILTVVGARPQFVKAATLSRCIASRKDVVEVLVHTGQHFDDNMSALFFREMNIPEPAYHLNVNNLPSESATAMMVERLLPLLQKEQPDCVLVYGDTNSTLAGARAAKQCGIPLAHVEAGLRSFNNAMPEEYNRIQTDKLSDFLFCPTLTAVENLNNESLNNNAVISLCGDVMYDACSYYQPKAIKPQINLDKEFFLSTVHRAENTDNQQVLISIFRALNFLAEKTQVVLPLHPRTRLRLQALDFDFNNSKITFIEPVGYFEMLYLLQHCSLVLTDSGGLQKEAYFFDKKCVTLRNETEWVELVKNGLNCLAGTDSQAIVNAVRKMSQSHQQFQKGLYGDGHTAERIITALMMNLK